MFSKEQLDELKKILPGRVSTSNKDLKDHCGVLSYIKNILPEVICYAESEDDVIQVVNFCIKYTLPLIPYGSGTSAEGHILAVKGGICLDMSRLNKILEFNPEDSYVVVQPGLSYNQLNEFLHTHGFHFPVEAGFGASIGGMTATNASGAGATDSGAMSKNVLACSAIVYKDRRAIKINVGTRSPKSAAGYNVLNLLIGSEGTLGIFTKIVLKIRRNFPCHATICCQFDEIQQAIKCISKTKGFVQFRRAELLDKLQTKACVSYSKIDFLGKSKNTLLIELSGNQLALQEESNLVLQNLKENQGSNIRIFSDQKSSEAIWMMRKNAAHAALQLIGCDGDKTIMATDVCVPL